MNLALDSFGGGPAGALFASLVAGAAGWHASRSRATKPLIALRGVAAGALALAALAPAIALVESRLEKPHLLILVDGGATMRGSGAGGTRWDQATRWLSRAYETFSSKTDARIVVVSDRLRAIESPKALSTTTPDAGALSAAEVLVAASGRRPDRIWLVSDGGFDSAELERAATELGIPFDTLGVGPTKRARGVALTDLRTPDFAFLHGAVNVRATFEATELSGNEARLILARFGDTGWETVASTQRKIVAERDVFSSSFTVTADRLGSARWRLSVAAGGVTQHRDFKIETVRQKYRIMYLAGRPSAEYAFLRDELKSNPNHELVSFVILRNPENPTASSARDLSLIPFPSDDIFGPALPKFDLFILENFSAARFRLPTASLERLKRFVSDGGALLIKGGENAFAAGGWKGSPIEDILPVALSAHSPDFVTGLFKAKPPSADHPLLRIFDDPSEVKRAWEDAPALDGWGRFSSLRAGAQAVLVHPVERADDGALLPVVAVRPYGRGKVMLVSTGSTWRWKLGAAGDRNSQEVYDRFWTRAVKYLTGALDISKVKFSLLPDHLLPREPLVATLRVFDEDFSPAKAAETAVTVTWSPPGGSPRGLIAKPTEPGLYSVELTGLSRGTHHLKVAVRVRERAWGTDEASFIWEPAEELPLDRAKLQAIADATGGGFYDLSRTSPERILGRLPPPRDERQTIRRLRPFSTPQWLLLTGILLALEWTLRRRTGMA